MDKLIILLTIALGFFFLLFLWFAVFWVTFRPWLRAFLGGAPVPLVNILAMRLRGNPPGLLIDVFLALRQRGIAATMQDVEKTYIARKGEGLDVSRLADLVEQRLRQQPPAD